MVLCMYAVHICTCTRVVGWRSDARCVRAEYMRVYVFCVSINDMCLYGWNAHERKMRVCTVHACVCIYAVYLCTCMA